MKRILILGGDDRQKELLKLFKGEKASVTAVFETKSLPEETKVNKYDLIVLPIPCSKDGKTVFSANGKLSLSLFDALNFSTRGTFIVGGNFSDSFRTAAEEKETVLFDLFGEKDFALYNAYLTAQGAVRLLLESTKEYVVLRRTIVTGFGKVGKATALFLKNLGLDVYVFARRNEALTEARALGFKTIEKGNLSPCVHLFDYIFNTVPGRLFTERDICRFKRGAVYFELASSPFGAEKSDFEKSEATFVFGGGLPGKYCPMAAAKEIKRRTEIFLEKKGDTLE